MVWFILVAVPIVELADKIGQFMKAGTWDIKTMILEFAVSFLWISVFVLNGLHSMGVIEYDVVNVAWIPLLACYILRWVFRNNGEKR